MEKETIAPLVKNTISKEVKEEKPPSGCCGGTPTSNADACCKLDEDEKAEGEEGCGCNTSDEKKSKTSCC
jgi:hypothetical protein